MGGTALLQPPTLVACAAILLFLYYRWGLDSSPFTFQDIGLFAHNKTIVVTGANAGLGFSAVKLLARSGTADCIIMACRNIHRCNDARTSILQSTLTKVQLFALELDLSSLTSVKQFVVMVQDTLKSHQDRFDPSMDSSYPPIHLLVNNAGIMGTQFALAKETAVEMQMQVNHLGHFALTSLLLPNLVTAAKPTESQNLNPWARIVVVSSLMGSLGPALKLDDMNFVQRRSKLQTTSTQKYLAVQSFLQYAASKRANLLFTHGLHQRLYEASNGTIHAVVAHPGYSRTSLVLSGWDFVPKWFRRYFSQNLFGSMSSDDGAMCILRAALDPKVSSDDYVGPFYGTFGKPTILGTSIGSLRPINNLTEVDTLWKWSESAIGWEFPSIH